MTYHGATEGTEKGKKAFHHEDMKLTFLALCASNPSSCFSPSFSVTSVPPW